MEFHSTDVSPWQSTDVGTPIVKGGARKADGSCLEVYAGGLDIGTREDQFHFVYQTLGGDASVTARVDQVVWEPGGKLGVMLREDLTPGARQVSMLLLNQPAGVKYSFARRETAGALTKPAKNSTELATPPNAWCRVERKGGDLIGSWSADGTTWTELSRVTLAMPESVLCGIAATSRDTTGAYLSLQGKLCDLSTSGGQVGPRFRRGDVDATGSLDISDAVGILSYLFQGTGTPACLEAADTDNNGEVDITDAVNNLGYQFLGQAPPEAPGPTSCGEDPKAPFLGCNQPCP